MNKKIFIKIISIYLFIVGILAFINSSLQKQPSFTLWFCYIGLVLLGIGIFLKNPTLILSQLNILAIPLIIWNIDFYYFFITEESLLGITNYFFQGQSTLSKFITLQHLYTVPLSLLALWLIKEKPSKKSKYISIIQIILFLILGFIFTPRSKNINCIYNSCIKQIQIPSPQYQIIWLVTIFIIILITDRIIKKFY